MEPQEAEVSGEAISPPPPPPRAPAASSSAPPHDKPSSRQALADRVLQAYTARTPAALLAALEEGGAPAAGSQPPAAEAQCRRCFPEFLWSHKGCMS